MIYTEFATQNVLNKLVNKQLTEHELLWDNLCVKTIQRQFHKKVPETSLTILSHKNGIAHCKIDGRYFKLCDSTFIIINPFQELEYHLDGVTEVQTFNLHFNYQFAVEAFQTLEQTLDDPKLQRAELPQFYNEFHYKDAVFHSVTRSLNKKEDDDHQSTFAHILYYLNTLNQRTEQSRQSLKCVKQSTKKELQRRLCIAKDMILSEYNTALSIEELSKEACLSQYHMIRHFKTLYGLSPYEMLKAVRLEKTKEHLENTDFPIRVIAELVGFKEANSLSNAFRHKFGISPSEYKMRNIE